MDNQQERRDAAIYLAAMIQGEGSIVVHYAEKAGRSRQSRCVSVRVQIYSSEPEVLEEIQRYCDVLQAGQYAYTYPARKNQWERKPVGRVYISGYKRLERFLPLVIPYLVGRKRYIAEHLFQLCQARAAVPIRTPYEPWQVNLIETLCPGRRKPHLESSQTNTSGSASEAEKIEPGLSAKAERGETVREYPSLTAAT